MEVNEASKSSGALLCVWSATELGCKSQQVNPSYIDLVIVSVLYVFVHSCRKDEIERAYNV